MTNLPNARQAQDLASLKAKSRERAKRTPLDESEFSSDLVSFEADVKAAVDGYYAIQSLNTIAGENSLVLEAINRTDGTKRFWRLDVSPAFLSKIG